MTTTPEQTGQDTMAPKSTPGSARDLAGHFGPASVLETHPEAAAEAARQLDAEEAALPGNQYGPYAYFVADQHMAGE